VVGLKFRAKFRYCALKCLIAIDIIECSLPVDLCEYSQNPEACKDWLDKNHPGFYAQINNLQSN